MGVNKKTDGRYIVGMGAPNENEYKGSQGWRDIFIQLTENGATPDSEEKLAFLRDYAIYHNSEGNAIMPPSVSVWVSNNGVTSAVNADDISLDGDTYTICGIKWDGSSWDYSNAGQSSGGGGSSLPSYTSADVGKVLTVGEDAEHAQTVVIVPEQTVTLSEENRFAVLTGADITAFQNLKVGDVASAVINGVTYQATAISYGGDATVYAISEVKVMIGYAPDIVGVVLILSDKPNFWDYTIRMTATVPSVAPVWKFAVMAYDYSTATPVEHFSTLYAKINGSVGRLADIINAQGSVIGVLSDTAPTIPCMAACNIDDEINWGVANVKFGGGIQTTAFDGTGLPTSGPASYYIANSVELYIIDIGDFATLYIIPTNADIQQYVP